MKRVLLLICAAFFAACGGPRPVSLIFDTDMAPDYDDVGALAVLHALADSGEAEILATVSSNRIETAVPCIDVINTYFGRPDIPLGAVKDTTAPRLDTWHKGLRWTEELPARYPHKVRSNADAEDAVTLYRRILSRQPDKSVVIVTVGFFSNLANLLASGPDEFSSLSGRDLVKAKVKRLVSMAAAFPEGLEFNVMQDPEASRTVFAQWPTPILISGFEIGEKIITGKRLAASDVQDSPVKDAYEMCLAQDDPAGRNSWDQSTVLVAVRGPENYYDVEKGTLSVNEDGSDRWEKSEDGPHARLLVKMPVEEVTRIIEDLMMHRPVSGK